MNNLNSARYEKAIYAKLKMLQAQIDYQRAKDELEESLTVKEMKDLNFNVEACAEVMSRLRFRADIKLLPCPYVGTKLRYNNVSVYLHQNPKCLGLTALKNIIKEK